MPAQIIIPRLGWAMEEGVFVGWLKRDGDTIREGEPLFSLEGEKAVEEVESLDSGILRIPPDAPQAGDSVVVGAVIAFVVQPGEPAPFENDEAAAPSAALSTTAAPNTDESSPAASSPSPSTGEGRGEGDSARGTLRDSGDGPHSAAYPSPPTPLPQGARGASAGESALDVPLTNGNYGRRPAAISPRARRAAKELGVDFTQIKGTGRTGRIRESDVVAASRVVAAREAPVRKTPSPKRTASETSTTSASPLRRTIAERMLQSQRSTAPVTLNTTADVSTLVHLRRQLKECMPAEEVPSFTDLLIRLTAPALAAHPALNSRWEGEGIATSEEINIGVAVDTEAGLLVPVLRDVAALNLRQITASLRDLAARARRRELKPEEMRGGTFTITNLGSFGIDAFTPIINYPECAVLGVGRIVRQPVVDAEDQVVIQDRISLSLTFDHRIVDGAPAARFLQQLSRFLENPIPRLIS